MALPLWAQERASFSADSSTFEELNPVAVREAPARKLICARETTAPADPAGAVCNGPVCYGPTVAQKASAEGLVDPDLT
jgi:hypothetical protein